MAVLSATQAASLATRRRWHRRVGLLGCFGLLVWSLSGALHPLLSRYQLPPASFLPPAIEPPPAGAPPLAQILARAGIGRVSHARLVPLQTGAAWQVELPGAAGLRYFSAARGEEIPEGERRHAEFLARHYLGEPEAPVRSVERIERFGGEYAWVNRLLPVHRVAFDRPDGMRVFVETRSGLLGTLLDDRKALFNRLFVLVHTWRLPGLPEPLRVGLAGASLLAVLATPLLGLALWLARRGLAPGDPGRRWHRRLGLAVALMVLASGASGAWHLGKGVVDRRAQRELPMRAGQDLPAAALATTPLAGWPRPLLSVSLVESGGRVHARLVEPVDGAPPRVLYLALATGPDAAPLEDLAFAGELAGRLAPECAEACDPARAQLVTRFGGEYGFVNKLLPVWRFEAGDTRLYVHAETGALAARVSPADYAEGWSFARLHKWEWLDPLGRPVRDSLQILWALLSAATALLGIRLLAGGRRRP